MTDLDLMTLGGIVTFIAVCGVYIYVREQFTASEQSEQSRAEPVHVEIVESKPRRAA